MKTIKELFEVYRPKSPDEQKFVDKHVAIKHKDRNGNGDDVFNASNVKTIKRKEERHGYDSTDDEKVYEEVVQIDEMKNMPTHKLKALVARGESDEEGVSPAFGMQIKAARAELSRRKKMGVKEEVENLEELELGDEVLFELDEEVELLDEDTVGYKNYTITARANKSGARELGDIKHVYGHEKKMSKLGVSSDEDGKYGNTHHVTVKNRDTGEVTHHHVYQSSGKDSTGKPTLSIRSVGKPNEQHSKHANVIAHYLSGKTKIKEDTDLAFFNDLLEMNLDEDTFTDASLAQLRVMKHKQMMKDLEKSSKIHPLMKTRRMSDAKKKLADLEAARDHYVVKHEKATAKKKGVKEEVDLDESLKSSIGKAEASRQRAIKKAAVAYKRHGDMDRAINDHDLFAKDAQKIKSMSEEVELDEKTLTPAELKKREEIAKAMERENPGMDKSKKMAIATAQAKKVAEEVEDLDELSRATIGRYSLKAKSIADNEGGKDRSKGRELAGRKRWGGTISGVKPARVAATNEEVEDLEELSKTTLGSYVKNAQGTILSKGMEMQQQVNRGSSDEARRKTAKKVTNRLLGVNKAVDRLTKEDVINRAIANYMPEERTSISLEDQLLSKIEHLPEGHAATLLVLFNDLTEDNQKTMIESVNTQEGINGLLDFAIQNRGE